MQPNFICYQLNGGVHVAKKGQLVVAHMTDMKSNKKDSKC